MGSIAHPMKGGMNPITLSPAEKKMSSTWALQMKATSTDQPSRVLQLLTGALLGNGGWVLSRGANDAGVVSMLFEFERHNCVDIYTVMIAVGLDLSQQAHIRFTELCQCTQSHLEECASEIVSVDIEIHTYAVGSRYIGASEAA
jgi:hypothetical protein